MRTTAAVGASAGTTTEAGAVAAAGGPAPLAARNLPADGRIAFYLGQDSSTLSTFKSAVLDTDAGFPRPAGTTLYTNLVGAPMSGLFQPTNYGSGDIDVPLTLSQYGGGLAVGLYLVQGDQTPLRALAGTADAATTARYRGWADELVRYLHATGRPVFLRIGYEFDGPWNAYDQAAYKAAFRYLAGRIHTLGASNVATVWQSAAWPGADDPGGAYDATAAGHLDSWYPGDDAVDWVGMSYFAGTSYLAHAWSCRPEIARVPPAQVQGSVLSYARTHRKPVFVAESAPQGYDTGNLTASCIFAGGVKPVPVTADQIWREWYQPYFDFIARNRDVVRGVSYIDTNWSSQPQWQCTDAACPNGYWGDSRVEANPLILSRFREQVSRMQVATGPAAAAPFAVPDYSPTGRSEAEYADLPQGGSTGIAVYDATASNQRSAIVYANGASIEFDHVAAGRTLGVRWATTTDGVRATVLVNGRARASYAVPNRGSATAWSLSTLGISVPADATVTFRLDSGDVAWIDYITPGQTIPAKVGSGHQR